MDPRVLLALADRCEREEPSVELDRAIEVAVRGMLARTAFPPAHTSSLDAARRLSNWVLLTASDIGADGLPLVVLCDPSTTPTREVRGMGGRTLELTWCAAALRARAAPAPRPEE